MIEFIQKAQAIAVTVDPPEGGIIGFIKQFGGTEASLGSVVSFIQGVIKFGLAFAGIFAIIIFLYGGVFEYVMSFGNDEKIKKASQTMLWSFVGLVIIAASYTILNILTSLFK